MALTRQPFGSGAARADLAGTVQPRQHQSRGTQKHYQANPDSPIFAELCGIAGKTVGLAEALAPCAQDIRLAFVYGSVAILGNYEGDLDVSERTVDDLIAARDTVVAAIDQLSPL